MRVGVVAGSPGAYKVRPYAELNSLDAVSVLFFDAPALTRADPPEASDGIGALSAAPVAAQKTATASAGLPMAVVPPPTGEQAQAER
ncbi:hypothetical protein AUC71_04585 [Methyloceanibacter marginalis]|uniref:Uncharacterized protein n=1 Tax=Methyloceanibacter marginalis TaxID=1774971 RepID=A0A1E3VRT2_9HYPH|nr:hypothetical protein AUC71_04585 [Methyloceanibacter marginalis]